MENILLKFLKPQGAVYSKRMAFYRSMERKSPEEIQEILKENLSQQKILNLVSYYVFAELNQPEDTPRVKITKEQLEQFFDVQ